MLKINLNTADPIIIYKKVILNKTEDPIIK